MPTKTELRAKLEALLREEGASFGSDALAGELVDVIERGNVLRLDPEGPKLPKRLEVVRLAEGWQRNGGWLAKVVVPGDLILAVVLGGWSAGAAERRVSLLEAAVAAYNREREEEEMEAEVGAILDEGIPKLLEMELAKVEEKAVAGERSRCLAIFDAFLSDLPAGWDFVRLRMREARGKVERGDHPAVDVPAWTGADDLPNPEPRHEWPKPAAVSGRMGGITVVARAGAAYRDLRGNEGKEVLRRWEEEPGLRERLTATAAILERVRVRRRLEPVGELLDDTFHALRILTGKES